MDVLRMLFFHYINIVNFDAFCSCLVASSALRAGRQPQVLGMFAGALLSSVIPFTLFVILPTNKLLFSPTLEMEVFECVLPGTEVPEQPD